MRTASFAQASAPHVALPGGEEIVHNSKRPPPPLPAALTLAIPSTSTLTERRTCGRSRRRPECHRWRRPGSAHTPRCQAGWKPPCTRWSAARATLSTWRRISSFSSRVILCSGSMLVCTGHDALRRRGLHFAIAGVAHNGPRRLGAPCSSASPLDLIGVGKSPFFAADGRARLHALIDIVRPIF